MAETLRHACENVGFMVAINHGVDQAQVEAMFAWAARFHAQPMEEKLKIRVNDHTIGYMPIAEKAPPNAAAQGKKPSQNEAYFLRRDRAADDPDVIAWRDGRDQFDIVAGGPQRRTRGLVSLDIDVSA